MGISNGAGGTVPAPTPAPVAPVVTPPVVSTPTTTTPVATTPTTTTPVATTPTTTASGSAPIAGTASAATTQLTAAQLLENIQGTLADYAAAAKGDSAAQLAAMQSQLVGWLEQFAAQYSSLAVQVFGQSMATMLQGLSGSAQATALANVISAVPSLSSAVTSYVTANPSYATSPQFTSSSASSANGAITTPGQTVTLADQVAAAQALTGPGGALAGGLTASFSPSNPLIALGGTATGPGGVSVSNQGGILIDNNTGLPVGQTSTESTGTIETSVDAWAQSVGLGALAPWINAQIGTYAGEGMDSSDIATTIADTINTAPGFDALMPGYNQRIANGFTNTDANTGAGIAGYLAYRQQIEAMAETAGMVPGTISPQMIGNSWANDVSTTELSERITTEYTDAANALPAVQAELANYGYTAGLTPGQLASMFLNPALTVQQLEQQLNSATAGGEGVLTGFGEIGQSQAYALQAFLSNGGQNNLTTGQAASFFGGPLGNGLSSLSQMAQTGFEGPQLGTAPGGPGVVSQAQLLGAGEGNASDLLATQRAAQTRAAPSQGGGGLEASQAGVGGVGFGSQ